MRVKALLAVVVLLFAAVACAAGAGQDSGGDKPNIVYIMADDLDADTPLDLFPNIAALMKDSVSLDNYVVTDSWCCPSRASILRSEYVHSHGVQTNAAPDGGFSVFMNRGEENSTLGTWMQAAGYRTAMIGKFLNAYPSKTNPSYVPPGWDDWQGGSGGGIYKQYDYKLVDNGKVESYGTKPQDYLDTVLTNKAVDFIHGSTGKKSSGKPFFLYLTPLAPHLPATAPPGDENAFTGMKVPRTASFNQADVSAEPHYIAKHKKMSPGEIRSQDLTYVQRLRSMMGVDAMVGKVMAALRASGELKRTYVVFTSDNGFHLGQHRLPAGKTTPYEEDIRVPFLISGPGLTAGQHVTALASTVDTAPTIAALGGAKVPSFAEGTSLLPALRATSTPAGWRTATLVEFYAGHAPDNPAGPDCDSAIGQIHGCPRPPSYTALRTTRYTYAEYVTGEKQLFDRKKDPLELHNIIKTAPKTLVDELATQLAAMRTCSGQGCVKAGHGTV